MTGHTGPVPCTHCQVPVVDTDTGPTHLDGIGNLAGWLCPLPHMTLATRPEPFNEQTLPPTHPLDPPMAGATREPTVPPTHTRARDVTTVPAASQRRHTPQAPTVPF
ncbi:MAG TPA: hypothetical protein VHJ83_03475 [Micromonosporaceae bacterium]|nr:hypothetical protein [Micromonosporaceae bacterium]